MVYLCGVVGGEISVLMVSIFRPKFPFLGGFLLLAVFCCLLLLLLGDVDAVGVAGVAVVVFDAVVVIFAVVDVFVVVVVVAVCVCVCVCVCVNFEECVCGV